MVTQGSLGPIYFKTIILHSLELSVSSRVTHPWFYSTLLSPKQVQHRQEWLKFPTSAALLVNFSPDPFLAVLLERLVFAL